VTITWTTMKFLQLLLLALAALCFAPSTAFMTSPAVTTLANSQQLSTSRASLTVRQCCVHAACDVATRNLLTYAPAFVLPNMQSSSRLSTALHQKKKRGAAADSAPREQKIKDDVIEVRRIGTALSHMPTPYCCKRRAILRAYACCI
jgi:hypothetical protein